MAHLIEGLLKLSRITRSEMNSQEVDMSALVRDISVKLLSGEPDRKIEFAIQEGIAVKGDVLLIRVVLENLLDDSWKFTGKHPRPKIEFGSMTENGSPIYFIRDNGAGFDMAYSDKLFGAFQRLHTVDEFPGTGIGLATVRRIIQRHGGRIWAESDIGRGATFYFTLH